LPRPVADALRIRIRIAHLNDLHRVREEFMALQGRLDG
jgi:hypothetical protein